MDLKVMDLRLNSCVVQSNRVDLDMIISNLIDNAIKYAGEEPRVVVELTCDATDAVVRVSDNGRGIPRHMRRKVFGRFVRLGSELERETPGTGLGLYIVTTLLKSMGGKIDVSESGLGGALFTVTLPLNAQHREVSENLKENKADLGTAVS